MVSIGGSNDRRTDGHPGTGTGARSRSHGSAGTGARPGPGNPHEPGTGNVTGQNSGNAYESGQASVRNPESADVRETGAESSAPENTEERHQGWENVLEPTPGNVREPSLGRPHAPGKGTGLPTSHGLAARGVGELIELALADEDPDGPIRWKAVGALHARGDLETFTEARRLCASDSRAERVLGVDILGELGAPQRPFVDKTLSVLRYLAAGDDDVRVLHAVLIAFGHLRDPRALPSVIELATHHDPTVRYGAAYALSHVLGRPADPAGLAALRRLAKDPDDDVADWAALGLILP